MRAVCCEHCERYYDDLPTSGSDSGRAFRDLEWEVRLDSVNFPCPACKLRRHGQEKVLKICQDLGVGAQFGGKYFAHDARIPEIQKTSKQPILRKNYCKISTDSWHTAKHYRVFSRLARHALYDFLGRHFKVSSGCHATMHIPLERHGASCPVGLGVSCSADRQQSRHVLCQSGTGQFS